MTYYENLSDMPDDRPLRLKLRHWLIRLVVGKTPVVMNIGIRPHHWKECESGIQVIGVNGGIVGADFSPAKHWGVTLYEPGAS